MNSRHIFLLSLLCLANPIAADDSFEESLRKKSLEEVRVLYQEELKRLESEVEFQKLAHQRKVYDELRLAVGEFVFGCQKYRSSKGYLGSEQDCEEAINMDRLINEQKKRIDFAERKLEEANPRLKAIKDCLQEKEYEAIEIK